MRDHFEARKDAAAKDVSAGAAPYKPIPPDALYLTADEWRANLAGRPHARLSPFVEPTRTGRRSTWAGAPAAPSRRSARPAT